MTSKRPHYTHVYVKIRYVRFRLMSTNGNGRYEAKIIGRKLPGVWDTLGTTRGHETSEAAMRAALKLADRRKLKVVDDPRALRMLEFKDRYGEDIP